MQKKVLIYLKNYISRLPVPTLVTYNTTSYELENEMMDETDIGPEVNHIYQVLHKYFSSENNKVLKG